MNRGGGDGMFALLFAFLIVFVIAILIGAMLYEPEHDVIIDQGPVVTQPATGDVQCNEAERDTWGNC